MFHQNTAQLSWPQRLASSSQTFREQTVGSFLLSWYLPFLPSPRATPGIPWPLHPWRKADQQEHITANSLSLLQDASQKQQMRFFCLKSALITQSRCPWILRGTLWDPLYTNTECSIPSPSLWGIEATTSVAELVCTGAVEASQVSKDNAYKLSLKQLHWNWSATLLNTAEK